MLTYLIMLFASYLRRKRVAFRAPRCGIDQNLLRIDERHGCADAHVLLKNGTCHSKRSLLWEIKDAGTGCYVLVQGLVPESGAV